MNNLKKLCLMLMLPLFLFSISLQCKATTGAPESIDVLGYDQKDKKIYVLRQFNDESCKLPRLYYFNLNSKMSSNKAVPVQSIYMTTKTEQNLNDCTDTSELILEKIEHIQKRLQTLNSIPTENFQVKIQQRKIETGQFWQHILEDYPVQRYTQNYIIQYQKLKSSVQKSISYNHAELRIARAYHIPQHNTFLVIVQYLGIPFETGYTVEDAVLIR
ncbi:hypothetical protein [Acinetobacter sp. CFCC 10889]|uniref:hypothetical protein n=1 Tax=Acinetobacter sp. CFCC 10889 TaxID=1775557 RepID=UPI000DD0D90F|nr:hypothetical protein [Acinetobacter sp. CFCC 10889]